MRLKIIPAKAKKYVDSEGFIHVVCPFCGYDWIPRVPNPKKCPVCQKRLQFLV